MCVNREVLARYRRILWAFSLTGTLGFIFANSLAPAAVSGAESGALFLTLWQIFPCLTHALVRKLAHLCEYALLGAHLFFLPRLFPRSRGAKPLFFFLGLFVALSDEGIQSFVSGRSAELRDVLIDVLGYFLGALFVFIVLFMCRSFRKKRRGQ